LSLWGVRAGHSAIAYAHTCILLSIHIVCICHAVYKRFITIISFITLYASVQMDVFDAAQKYMSTKTPVIILAGKEYGSGSSRDWAAKGPWMLVSRCCTVYM